MKLDKKSCACGHVLVLFYVMTDWPFTIPHDLDMAMESTDADKWEFAFRRWARSHGLRIKIQWYYGLNQMMRERERWRVAPFNSDRWLIIKEWLERYEVEAPDKLPIRPEITTEGSR